MRSKRSQPPIEGVVRSLTRRGLAVVDTANGEVVVHGAAPGEHVRLMIDGKHHGMLQGRVVRIEIPSPLRVEPECAHAARCGGCPWMHIALAEQRRIKREMLESQLQREQLAPPHGVEWVDAGADLHYRTRARLHWVAAARGRPAKLGFHGWRNEAVEDIDACSVLTQELNTAFAQARRNLLPLATGAGELRVYQGFGGKPALTLVTDTAQRVELYAELERLVSSNQLSGAALKVGAAAPATFGDAREYVPREGSPPLVGGLGGFSQANLSVNRTLVSHVVEFADSDGLEVAELFAGFGNITVELASCCIKITAVEADRDLVAACTQNLGARGFAHAHVREARAEDVAPQLKGDVLVLDPPREGARDVARSVANGKFKRIVYVSCNPTTFARDAAALTAGRYTLERVVGFDMFPHTPHIESVALFRRT